MVAVNDREGQVVASRSGEVKLPTFAFPVPTLPPAELTTGRRRKPDFKRKTETNSHVLEVLT